MLITDKAELIELLKVNNNGEDFHQHSTGWNLVYQYFGDKLVIAIERYYDDLLLKNWENAMAEFIVKYGAWELSMKNKFTDRIDFSDGGYGYLFEVEIIISDLKELSLYVDYFWNHTNM